VKDQKVGSCIVVGGVPAARIGIGREEAIVRRGSRKKVIAEKGAR
jgi:hypothetical protein